MQHIIILGIERKVIFKNDADREDFIELLADRVDIVQAVFKAMVARLRQLAEVVKGGP